MIIGVNITFIFQAFNFLIAYLLLRFLLFKPAYAIIQQEQHDREDMQNGIAHQRSLLVQKEQEIKDHWLACQEHFLKNKPPINNQNLYIFKHISPSIEHVHIPDETVNILINDVEQKLIKRIGQ